MSAYYRTGLTGGTVDDLDGIDTTGFADKLLAIVEDGSNFYMYQFDSSSTASESSPDVIAPDTGTGRWILQTDTSSTTRGTQGLFSAATPTTIFCPKGWATTPGGTHLAWAEQTLDPTTAANRDDTFTALGVGTDYYLYITADGLKFSTNTDYPTGYSTATVARIAGFHTLCVDVGTISGHTLTGYTAGQILPQSVWGIGNMPNVDNPAGMVYDPQKRVWVDIYLASVSDDELASIYNATIADGTSSPAFHLYKFEQWLARIGKRMPDQQEFVSLSLGSNQGTNISGSADPVTTGGHVDTASRRMISNIGCEDCCGAMWQWGAGQGGGQSGASFVNAYDANDADVGGQHYQAPNRPRLGGSWVAGASCGSRGSVWNVGPLNLSSDYGGRGLAEPLYT